MINEVGKKRDECSCLTSIKVHSILLNAKPEARQNAAALLDGARFIVGVFELRDSEAARCVGYFHWSVSFRGVGWFGSEVGDFTNDDGR